MSSQKRTISALGNFSNQNLGLVLSVNFIFFSIIYRNQNFYLSVFKFDNWYKFYTYIVLVKQNTSADWILPVDCIFFFTSGTKSIETKLKLLKLSRWERGIRVVVMGLSQMGYTEISSERINKSQGQIWYGEEKMKMDFEPQQWSKD